MIAMDLPEGLLLFECKLQMLNKNEMLDHIKTQHRVNANFWAEFQAVTTYAVKPSESSCSTIDAKECSEDALILDASDPSESDLHNEVDNVKMWTVNRTLRLIEEVKRRLPEFETTMKKFVWEKIAETISNDCGKEISVNHCESKWKSLKRTYKTAIQHNNSTGKNRKRWEYFTVMHDILFSKPEINSQATCSSYAGLVVRDDNSLTSAPATSTSSHSLDDAEDTEFSSRRKQPLLINDIKRKWLVKIDF